MSSQNSLSCSHRRLSLLPCRVPFQHRMIGQAPHSDRNLRAGISGRVLEKVCLAADVILQPGTRRSRLSVRRWRCPIGRLPSHRSEARSPGLLMFRLLRRRQRARLISMLHRRCGAFLEIFRVHGPRAGCHRPSRRRRVLRSLPVRRARVDALLARCLRRCLWRRRLARRRQIPRRDPISRWISHIPVRGLRNSGRNLRRPRMPGENAARAQKSTQGSSPRTFRVRCGWVGRSGSKFASPRRRSRRCRKVSKAVAQRGSTKSP